MFKNMSNQELLNEYENMNQLTQYNVKELMVLNELEHEMSRREE